MKISSEQIDKLLDELLELHPKKNSALNFLKEYGNPFLKIGTDQSGRNAIEWGVYGVPETFAIDQEGRVLFRHAGPITKEIQKNYENAVLGTDDNSRNWLTYIE